MAAADLLGRDAAEAVLDRQCPGHVGADQVAGDDHVLARVQEHAVIGIPRDEVAEDEIAAGPAPDVYADADVGDGDRPGRIGPDVVAGDHVALVGHRRVFDVDDAVAGVAGDHVPVGHARVTQASTPDLVIHGVVPDPHA